MFCRPTITTRLCIYSRRIGIKSSWYFRISGCLGWTASRYARNSRRLNPASPVVLSSGYSYKEFKTRMDELDAEAFLAKPYQTHDVLQCVRKILDGSHVSNLT